MAGPRIMIFDGKHDMEYYDASTPELWAESCVQLLSQMDSAGWYQLLDEPEFTPVDTEGMPEPYKTQAEKDNRRASAQLAEAKRENDVVRAIKKCIAEHDVSLIERGPEGRKKAVPVAWELLQRRSDYEYEGVRVVTVWSYKPEPGAPGTPTFDAGQAF